MERSDFERLYLELTGKKLNQPPVCNVLRYKKVQKNARFPFCLGQPILREQARVLTSPRLYLVYLITAVVYGGNFKCHEMPLAET